MPSQVLNPATIQEIDRIVQEYGYSREILENLVSFAIKPPKLTVKPPKIKQLTLPALKEAVYKHFETSDTKGLKKSGAFQMATDGLEGLNLSQKQSWERLYRQFIGILPGEEQQKGYGCINGRNIFDYFRPWEVFGLDAKTATTEDIKKAYKDLSKIYHPDNSETGDAKIFQRLNQIYRSLVAEG